MKRGLLLLTWASIALLFGFILWAAQSSSLFDEFGVLMESRWFVVTMVDLYLGLLVFAAWALYCEERREVAAMWIVTFLCLGNLMTLAYLLWRARDASKAGGSVQRFFLGRNAPGSTSQPGEAES